MGPPQAGEKNPSNIQRNRGFEVGGRRDKWPRESLHREIRFWGQQPLTCFDTLPWTLVAGLRQRVRLRRGCWLLGKQMHLVCAGWGGRGKKIAAPAHSGKVQFLPCRLKTRPWWGYACPQSNHQISWMGWHYSMTSEPPRASDTVDDGTIKREREHMLPH